MAKAKAAKVLNLSGSRKAAPATETSDGYSSASSVDAGKRAPASESGSEESESEDEEFEIPPGFEAVQGSASITRESVLDENKELWFFKLPKHVDAAALKNVSFKIGKQTEAGAVVASVKSDGKTYSLQTEDPMLTSQLVNAFPSAKDRKKFTLAKPFSRCFSLIEDRPELTPAGASGITPVVEADEEPTPKKSKKNKAKSKNADEAKPAKKAKTKK